jgi:membrane associated rhomboid family serine protease
MRRRSFAPRWSMTLLLVIANVVAFMAQSVLTRLFPRIIQYSELSIPGLSNGYIWQLLTFQFMHGGILHLLLNCWAIYMFGREVESALGRKSFLLLYFSSGVIGGLTQVAFSEVLSHLMHDANFRMMQVVGASAGAFGLIAAFAILYPERPLMMLLFFIIPVNMRAKFLLLFEGIVALVGMALSARPSEGTQIADAAHLGGMLTGIFFVRYAVHWQWPQFPRPKRRPLQRLIKVPSQKSALWGRTKNAGSEELPPEEFLSQEVDPILDKISAHGIQSLTERERRILQAAREKMGKR